MRTPIALLILLAAATAVHANSPPPGFKYVPRDIHVEFAEAYPGYTFFVVTKGYGERVPSTDGDVNLSRLVPGGYVSHRTAFRLCAVPDDLLANRPSDDPDWKWFQANSDNPRLRWATFDPPSEEPSMGDPRDGIVQKYRLTLTPTAIEKELISERTEPAWPTLAVYALLFVSVVLFVVWLIRRRSLTRTTPPPGN